MNAKLKNNSKPRAILIDVIPPETTRGEAAARLEELEKLTKTYGGVVVLKTIQQKIKPDYETYIGRGKLKEIQEESQKEKADLLIVNNILKPGQLFNLEEKCREYAKENEIEAMEVWDRVELILKIFSKHAKSTEAKLQIELAQIKHMGPRIFGMGKELMRQEGRMGVRGGSGEANIEMMKRHLRTRELKIQKKLEHYETIREGHRKNRRRKNLKTVALVGYTNAGKSSLLNALTGKDIYIADELFATLDTRIGKIFIPETREEILMSDTIGFIRDLPPSLIKAFKSTLAETIDSDLLLHVIDVSDPEIHKKIKVVEEILTQLGLEEKPRIYVFNKTDLIPDEPDPKALLKSYPSLLKAGPETAKHLGWHKEDKKRVIKNHNLSRKSLIHRYRKFSPIFVSAADREGLEELKSKMSESV